MRRQRPGTARAARVSQPWLQEAIGTAEWGGTPLSPLLEEAGVPDGTVEVLFTGLDRGIDGGIEQAYQRSLTLDEAMRDDVLLACEMNGQPLPAQHGFPLRLVVPGWYGMTSVKWLERIAFLDRPFDGYQQAHSYRLRRSEDDEGEPLTRMRAAGADGAAGRAGLPFAAALRRAGAVRDRGPGVVGGRADPAVEVSTDGGESPTRGGGRGRRVAGRVDELAVRLGRDGRRARPRVPRPGRGGQRTAVGAAWNVGGYANNAVQRVPVLVRRS